MRIRKRRLAMADWEGILTKRWTRQVFDSSECGDGYTQALSSSALESLQPSFVHGSRVPVRRQ